MLALCMAYQMRKKGARFTIALGLRVLTLQTGLSLRQDLQLSDEVLAILVGGGGIRQLFEIGEQHKTKMTPGTAWGSESAEALVDGFVDFASGIMLPILSWLS